MKHTIRELRAVLGRLGELVPVTYDTEFELPDLLEEAMLHLEALEMMSEKGVAPGCLRDTVGRAVCESIFPEEYYYDK